MANNNVYINLIEGNSIYGHTRRNGFLKVSKTGMMANSLLLHELNRTSGFKVKELNKTGKLFTNDIINVTFDYGVNDADFTYELVSNGIEKKLEELAKTTDTVTIEKLEKSIQDSKQYLTYIEENKHKPEWNKLSAEELRKILYVEGFKLNIDGKEIEYVEFSRSTSKGRTGETLFIKKSLFNKINKWQRMGLKFGKNEAVDLVSLRAYETLTSSGIIETMKIDVESILIVEDIKSTFKQKANVVYTVVDDKGNKGLDVKLVNDHVMSNDIFDGESLMDNSLFIENGFKNKGFALLRNHFFKSASFNTNIQQFLMDNCPENVNFEDWELVDMFGNKIKASTVKVITTPNSCKFLKFAYKMGLDNDKANKSAMFDYWKSIVKLEGDTFGICKFDKKSNNPLTSKGERTRGMSYQMINGLLADAEDIKELLQLELDYVQDLKNDNDVFIKHLERTSSTMNNNNMYVLGFKANPEFAKTELFKTFKTLTISSYVKELKTGKVRVVGDYLTMLSNPIELLKSAIGSFNVLTDVPTLQGNQVSTSLFEHGEELVMHRNPTTNMTNTLLSVNVINDDIKKYLNIGDNVIVVNSINHPICNILSGADFDSDTTHVSNNKTLIKLAKRAEEFYVCDMSIKQLEVKAYTSSKLNCALADNLIAESKYNIGIVVNASQNALSMYHHLKSLGMENGASEMLKITHIVNILSMLAIDSAKKDFEINVGKAVSVVNRKVAKFMCSNSDLVDWSENEEARLELENNIDEKLKFKPMFFKNNVDRKQRDNVRYIKFNTPMDELQIQLSNLKYAKHVKSIPLVSILNKVPTKHVRTNQIEKLEELAIKIKKELDFNNTIKNKDARCKAIQLSNLAFEYEVNRYKINEATLYTMMKMIERNELKGNAKLLMKVLFETNIEIMSKLLK